METIPNLAARPRFGLPSRRHPSVDAGFEFLREVYPDHILDRFPSAGKGPWTGKVREAEWDNWRWQQTHRIRDLDSLSELIDTTDEESRAVTRSASMFRMGITPYYAVLMDRVDSHCPVRLQAVPRLDELRVSPSDLLDPLGEEADMPVPGLTHRYPDRVLLYTTHNCPVYCRHCTRKRKVADPSSAASQQQLDTALDYIERHREIRDVVLSGGDPLSLSNARLDELLGRLRAIPHVELIRLGTRNLVTLPQRIDDEFIRILFKYPPVHVNTHFNHPKEMTRESLLAATRLAMAGVTMGNQSVLLKDVNDDPEIMLELCQKLLLMRIRPYYIYQCDLAQGISHFRTSVAKGIEIIERLRGWTSGLAVPQFVIDAPGGGGKVPINPEYMIRQEPGKVVIRNYENREFVYFESSPQISARPANAPTRGPIVGKTVEH
jgi:lysine 2,3-aminomutase